ncbi:MAG: hypothetical protein ACIPMY_07235 [Rickettsia endosymbiont of Pentastiridius leporinus]
MKLKEIFSELEKFAFGPWAVAFKKFFSEEELNMEIEEIENKAKTQYQALRNHKNVFQNLESSTDKYKLDISEINKGLNLYPETLNKLGLLNEIQNTLQNAIQSLDVLYKQSKEIIEKVEELRDKTLIILSNDIIETTTPDDVDKTLYITKKYKTELYKIFQRINQICLDEFSNFILNLPKNHLEYSDYFLTEEKKDGYSKIKAFKNVVDKNLLIDKFTELKAYEKIKENTRALETYLESFHEYNCGIQSDLLGVRYNNYESEGI